MNHSYWVIVNKIIGIIAFICIIISLIIIIITPPAKSYELSIYSVYPMYFWFLLVIEVFLGQLIILKDVIYGTSEKKNNSWLLGIIIILIPIFILLYLPLIRGYATYGFGDHLSHIGEVKDVLQGGIVGKTNFYPNLHILTAGLTLVTDSDVIYIVNFLSRFFFIISPISLYLFYLVMFKNKNEMKCALVLASAFVFFGFFCKYIAPYNLSFLLVPLILYLYLKRENIRYSLNFSILFVLIIISYTFYHPLNILFLILIFLFFSVTFYVYPKINIIKVSEYPEKTLKEKSINIFLFSILLFIIWYFSFASIIGSFYRVFSSIFYGAGESFFQSQASALKTFTPTLFDTIKTILFTYGILFIIFLLSFFSLIYLFIHWRRNKQDFRFRFCLIFSGTSFLIFGALLISAFFANFIVSWNRFLVWVIIFSIILITLALTYLISTFKDDNRAMKWIPKSVITIIVCAILISITYVSTFTFYNSPLTGDANLQVTKKDWAGIEWIVETRNTKRVIQDMGVAHWRYSDAINGVKATRIMETQVLESMDTSINPIPDHFSYNNKSSLGESYNISVYMIITRLARIRYPEAYPNYKELWRYTPEDFNQLQDDDTIFRIFNNGDFDVYLIQPRKNL
jgi:hypothetical protein